MNPKRMIRLFPPVLAFSLLGVAVAGPVGTTFTYQGQLKLAGAPVDDLCEFQFTLWESEFDVAPSARVGPVLSYSGVDAITVVDGLFTAELDFGANAFDGNERFLQISVRCASQVDYVTLTPRQRVSPTPYAIRAATVPWSGLDNVPGDIADGDDVGLTSESDPTVVDYVKDGVSWSELSDIPGDILDGDDVGLTSESDPTVVAYVKDGVDWSELGLIPPDIADGDQDTHLSEAQVESYITNGPLDLAAGTTLNGQTLATGAHTIDTNATTLCDGPGVFLDGAGNCVAVGAGADGHSLDAADGFPEDVVYVDHAGRVGVGTTLPESWLDVRAPEDSGNLLSLVVESAPVFTADTLGHVGIGMSPQPDWTLGVEGSSNTALFLNTGWGNAGKFVNSNVFTSSATILAESNGESDSTHVIHAEYTGEYGVDAVGVYGESSPRLGKGIGGEFRGGHIGAIGSVDADLTGNALEVYGLAGTVAGDAAGSVDKYGVAGRATGNGYANYGVYGYASGAYGYNYAGYFESDHDSFDTHVLHVEYTGSATRDPLGLYVKCAPGDYRGIAAEFIGGNTGIHAEVSGGLDQPSLDYNAIEAEAWGSTTGIMRALYGSARGSGTNYGVHGEASGGAKNYAGYFTSDAVEFDTHVVHAEVTGSGEGNPTAVYGKAKPGNYWGYGGYFEGGRSGAYGFVEAGTDSEFLEYAGFEGVATGLSGIKRGIVGDASGAGTNYGVYGIASGGSTNYSGYFYGVAPSSETHVVHAEFGVPAAADAKAVYGECDTVDYYGFGGHFVGGYVGAKGEVSPTGSNSYYGLWGAVNGGSGTNYGVFGVASGSGTNYAGYFQGDVHVTGTLTAGSKSFKIDHPLDPENKYLIHTSVESPDMMTVYNGNATTDANGRAWVELPAYFEALNRDYRYQLTVIGAFSQAIVAQKIKDNRFLIRTDKPKVEVSWQVTGIRQDPYANAHRSPVEQDKPKAQRGLYLHPVERGVSADKGLYARIRSKAVADSE